MATIAVAAPADLGPALREVRVADGVTQSALAELAGVGRQWLNAFEMGDRPSAPLDMVMRVLAAIGATVTLAPSLSVAEPTPAGEEPIDLDELLREYDQ